MEHRDPKPDDAPVQEPSRGAVVARVAAWLILGGVAIALMSCGTCQLK